MMWFLLIPGFVLGVIIGSFLNVLVFRLNTGKTLMGRSECLSCRTQLGWKDLIPMASYFLLRGKCRTCCTPIDPQYPIVEFVTGIGFAIIASAFWWLTDSHVGWYVMTTLFWAVLFSLSVFIAVYDFRHKVIYARGMWVFLGLAVIGALFGSPLHGQLVINGFDFSFIPFLAGVIVVLPFFILWLYSGGRWIGFGDLELMVSIGLLLGMRAGFSAIILGFWASAFTVLGIAGWTAIRKRSKDSLATSLHPKREIPFAPFLLLGLFLVGVCMLDVFGIIGRI